MALSGAGAERALGIIGAVAHQLNAGLPPEQTLAAVAETLQEQLPARSVSLWVHEPNATTFARIGPTGRPSNPEIVASLGALPPLMIGRAHV